MSVRAIVFVSLLLSVAVVFTLFPALDQGISALFYRAGGGGFFLYENPLIRGIHDAVPPLAIGSGVALLAILAGALWMKRPIAGLSWRSAIYLLAVLIVAPGLLTNTVLKDNWGRARPSHTVEFGGKKAFTPALVISDQCDHNCSFVCGHAAMAFTPVALAFVLRTRRQRRGALAAGLGLGGLVGLVRIIEGGHFLSDVLFAGLLVYGVSWGLAAVLLPRPSLSRSVSCPTT
ncbi:MAG: phosphatase PAP2 family protein [Magnetospirillum sp.]|nr:MAG: phosphatase PAP2 family protein [Magnetospirillum sp.]